LVHELLGGIVNAGDGWMNLTVGESVSVPTSLKLSAVPLLTDAMQKQFVLEALTGGAVAYRSGPLERPGVYHMTAGSMSFPIAVNLPGDEADVRTIENGAIRKALGEIDVDLQGDQLPPETMEAGAAGEDFGWPVM